MDNFSCNTFLGGVLGSISYGGEMEYCFFFLILFSALGIGR